MAVSFYVGLVTLIVSAILTPFCRWLANRTGIIDRPDHRKIHLDPTPLLGGLAIYGAAVVSFLLFFEQILGEDPSARLQSLGMFAGATILMLVGVLDDRGHLHSQVKLFVAIPAAALVVALCGVRVTIWPFVGYLEGSSPVFLVVSYVLTLIWIVGVTAAFSIFDHMDGLCSGITAIAASFFLFFAVLNGQILVAALAAALLGGCLGFLYWNFNPARIFMGDGGALFLGFMMAVLGIKLRFPEITDASSWTIPVLVLGVPLFDAFLVTVSRIRRGLNPVSTPGKDHMAHRLVHLGMSHRSAIACIYLAGLLLGAATLVIHEFSVQNSFLLLGFLFLAVISAVFGFERAMTAVQVRASSDEANIPPPSRESHFLSDI